MVNNSHLVGGASSDNMAHPGNQSHQESHSGNGNGQQHRTATPEVKRKTFITQSAV